MNGAYAHLLVNHVSLFCVFFGIIALGVSLRRGSKDLYGAALALFILAGIMVWLATTTGDSAEEIVKTLPAASPLLIHRHEAAADLAQISTLLLAFAAVFSLWRARKHPFRSKRVRWMLLGLALVSLGLLGRAAKLGGEIRHPEVRGSDTPMDMGGADFGGSTLEEGMEPSESDRPGPEASPTLENPESI